MVDFLWIILGYLAIGLAFVECIRWSREKGCLVQLDGLPVMFVFFFWPFIILLSLIMIWRKKP